MIADIIRGPITVDETNKDELRDQLDILERNVADLQRATNRALGFVKNIEYQGITFNVSRRFVIAELTPLIFFHLVERVEQRPVDQRPAEQRPIDQRTASPAPDTSEDSPNEGVGAAIVRLYHRLSPLLSCRHEWTPLRRAEDDRIRSILGSDRNLHDSRPFICKLCTAYALGSQLPVIGKSLE